MECPAPALIIPRRHFLRAFGLTAAGHALPIPLLLADTPEQRITLQLAELAHALAQMYPATGFTSCWRRPSPHDPTYEPFTAGEIVAVIKAGGARPMA